MLFVVFAVRGPLSPAEVRGWLAPLGASAPVAFVAVSVGLNVLLVPGALLAATSGLLFGPLLGTALSLVAATLSALVAVTIARATGRAGVEQLAGRRITAAGNRLKRHGFGAVVTARLAPGVPDTPAPTLPASPASAAVTLPPGRSSAAPRARSPTPRSAARSRTSPRRSP